MKIKSKNLILLSEEQIRFNFMDFFYKFYGGCTFKDEVANFSVALILFFFLYMMLKVVLILILYLK